MLVLVKRAEPAQQTALPEAEHWAALSTALKVYLQGSAWELFRQGFHGSYLLRALLSFIIQRCAAIYPFEHQPTQQEQLLSFNCRASKLARMAISKVKEENRTFFLLHLLPCFSSFCSSTRVWHCSSRKRFQQMPFITASNIA